MASDDAYVGLGSTDHYCSDPLGVEGHDYRSTKPAGVSAFVRWCRLCHHIDGRALAETLTAAEQRGRARAIAELRDADRFVHWAFKSRPDTGVISDVCADYLEAQTEEAGDG